MYSCEHSDYKSTQRYNLNVHVKNKHGPYQRAPTTMSVPPVQTQAQKGGGVTQHFDQEDEEDYESEDSNQSRHFLDTTDEEMEMEENEIK